MSEDRLDQEKIAKFIAKKRKEKEYTQEKLGEIMGVSSKSVSKWENGRTLPDIGLFPKLAKVLGVSIADLFYGETIIETSKEKISLINNSTEKIIKSSNRKALRKARKVFVGLIGLFIIIFGLYIHFSNYYKYNVYTLTSENNDFSVVGYLTQNIDNTVLAINSINYYDTSIGTDHEVKVTSLEIEIESNGKMIESQMIDSQSEIYLSELLNRARMLIHITKNEEEQRKINIDDLYMTIRYIHNGQMDTISLKLITDIA